MSDRGGGKPLTGEASLNALADLMADGCPTIAVAAKRMGISGLAAHAMWDRIKYQLGIQAE